MKGKMVKRLLAVGLSIAMAVTTFQTVGTSGPGIVQAASTVTNENLLKILHLKKVWILALILIVIRITK